MYRHLIEVPGDEKASRRLASIDQAIRDAALKLTNELVDSSAVTAEISQLRQARIRARQASGLATAEVLRPYGLTIAEAWDRCINEEQRRHILREQIETLTIRRGRPGRGLDTTRVLLSWTTRRKPVAPEGLAAHAVHTTLPTPEPWILPQAAQQ